MLALILTVGLSANLEVFEAKYDHCRDGDTCLFRVNQGFQNLRWVWVRFCNLNAPETRTLASRTFGIRSKNWLSEKLHNAGEIELHFPLRSRCNPWRGDECETRSFDRLVAWVIADQVNLTFESIRTGHGELYTKKTCGAPPTPEVPDEN
jgi:hypothetical protein